ncbi:MAG: S8 family serine peptidase [Candidatus Rokubacteria bacterium]|nr:S8 family serine peptidase [Candidatus Rokubacteria bacterium]
MRVIVKLYAPETLPEGALTGDQLSVFLQRLDIADLQRLALDSLAGTSHQVLWRYVTSPYMALEVSAPALRLLATSLLVEELVEDFELTPRLVQSGPIVQTPGLATLGATGEGQTIVIVDSGVDRAHPFFGGRVIQEWCTVSTAGGCPNGASGAGAASPVSAHGTHVAGIAAGAGSSFAGVAPAAALVAIKVFGPGGTGRFADVKAALDRVLVLKDSLTIAAVNMSLGAIDFLSSSTCDGVDVSIGLKTDIDALRAAGIATVVANGNDGSSNAIGYPACLSSAIRVGATTKSDTIASYSDRAPALEASMVFAPGGNGASGSGSICSARPPGQSTSRGTCSGPSGGTYGYEAGTSMATPHVAGAWAVLKQAKPSATVDEVLAALRSTAELVTDSSTGATYRRVRVRHALGALTGLGVTLAADRTSPQAAGTTIRFTATPTGGVGTIRYKWRVYDGAAWGVTQDWSTTATYDWTPASGNAGYVVSVWARSGTLGGDDADGTAATATSVFVVTNPAPVASALSLTSVAAGGDAFALTVTGSGFVRSSVVAWNGASRGTTFVSATELRAAITAADIAAPSTASIAVVSPSPGGGTSATLSLTVAPGVPVASSLSPTSIIAGNRDFTLAVVGSRFTTTSAVRVNGVPRATTYVSTTRLTIAMSASEVEEVRSYAITVVTPAANGHGGGTSSAITLPIVTGPPLTTAQRDRIAYARNWTGTYGPAGLTAEAFHQRAFGNSASAEPVSSGTAPVSLTAAELDKIAFARNWNGTYAAGLTASEYYQQRFGAPGGGSGSGGGTSGSLTAAELDKIAFARNWNGTYAAGLTASEYYQQRFGAPGGSGSGSAGAGAGAVTSGSLTAAQLGKIAYARNWDGSYGAGMTAEQFYQQALQAGKIAP